MMTEDGDRVVFIKNIPYDIDDDLLSDWCSTFGAITKCSLKRDKFGHSRGFAFVTFASIDGHNNILSKAPHFCQGRNLLVRSASDQTNSNEYQSNSSSDQCYQTASCLSNNENLTSTTADNSLTFDDDHHDRLASLRDELEANLECMQIAHEHEVKILREKLSREKKLLKEAEELHKEAKDDWCQINSENSRLRTSLIKNVMQTFNIRRDLARQIKDQSKKTSQIEKQCDDLKSNRIISKIDETTS